MAEPSYFAAAHATVDEAARLAALEAELDPRTHERLRSLGVGEGLRPWRCLEVGGGGGSIARHLASLVAPHGHVTATDLDVRFLAALDVPNLTVRRHDVVQDPLEPLAYDLVHCRLLLGHLPDPGAVIDKLAGAVAPGGALLVEEFEYGPLQVADRTHPLAGAVTRVNDALLVLTARLGIDVELGRRLPDLLEAVGLVDVDHVGTLRVTRGTPGPTMAKASTALLAPRLLEAGLVEEADLRAWFDALGDPAFRMIDYALMSAWGRRPVL